jgi:plasmid stabilization system protein ParE
MEVRYSRRATAKIETLCAYYEAQQKGLRKRARLAITETLRKLSDNPMIGRPFQANPDYREKVIGFGSSHLIALYRVDAVQGFVVIVAIRHERELGYDVEGP